MGAPRHDALYCLFVALGRTFNIPFLSPSQAAQPQVVRAARPPFRGWRVTWDLGCVHGCRVGRGILFAIRRYPLFLPMAPFGNLAHWGCPFLQRRCAIDPLQRICLGLGADGDSCSDPMGNSTSISRRLTNRGSERAELKRPQAATPSWIRSHRHPPCRACSCFPCRSRRTRFPTCCAAPRVKMISGFACDAMLVGYNWPFGAAIGRFMAVLSGLIVYGYLRSTLDINPRSAPARARSCRRRSCARPCPSIRARKALA